MNYFPRPMLLSQYLTQFKFQFFLSFEMFPLNRKNNQIILYSLVFISRKKKIYRKNVIYIIYC
jgi:hypothetical protein